MNPTALISTRQEIKHYMIIPANILLCGLNCSTTYEPNDPNREDLVIKVDFTETPTQLIVTHISLLFLKSDRLIVGADISTMLHMPKITENIYKIISTEIHRKFWDSDKRWWE